MELTSDMVLESMTEMITNHIKKKTKKFVRKTKGGKPYVKASQEYLQPEKVAKNKYCES